MLRYKEYIKEKLDMSIKISIEDVNTLLKKIFNKDKISYIKTLYEYDKENDYYKLVVIINNLFYNKTNIFYTKLIFFVNKEKTYIVKNEFSYLYELNCKFKHINIESLEELELKISDIFANRKFGRDIKYLSDFLVSPASLINEWLTQNNVANFSIYNIEFNPDIKIIPCKSLYFKFNINIDDKNIIELKISKRKLETETKYLLEYNINDIVVTDEINSIESLIQSIGLTLKNNIKG